MGTHFTNDERERLEQELLELHFGCHEAPDGLRARLEREPALRELQQQVLRTADVLAAAATPAQAALSLAAPRPVRTWWRRPVGRILGVAAAAAAALALAASWHGVQSWREASARAAQCQLTLSAPQAVPAGAPWSFTVETADLDGGSKAVDLRWRALGVDGTEIAHSSQRVDGRSVVAIPAGLAVPSRLEVTARHAGRGATRPPQVTASNDAPHLPATTAPPFYQPGRPVPPP